MTRRTGASILAILNQVSWESNRDPNRAVLHEVESDRHPARIAWQTALKNLKSHADAELPGDECAV